MKAFCFKDGTPIFKPDGDRPGMMGSEEQEQIALFQWAAAREYQFPALAYMFHVPNGGRRGKAEAARLKEAGVKAGVPDICLPVKAGGYSGLYIELKAGENTAQAEQIKWLHFLREQDYFTCVCYGWSVAAAIITLYVKGGITKCA